VAFRPERLQVTSVVGERLAWPSGPLRGITVLRKAKIEPSRGCFPIVVARESRPVCVPRVASRIHLREGPMMSTHRARSFLATASCLLAAGNAVAQQPTAALSAPTPVEYGDPILLNGAASQAAVGRSLTSWRWTRLAGGPGGGTLGINQEVTTQIATFTVESPASSPLGPGVHHFQLVVTDDAGYASAPAAVEVLVRDSRAPVAVLGGPSSVPQTSPIALDGSGSYDHAPGQIRRWLWLHAAGSGGAAPANQVIETDVSTFTVQANPPFESGLHRFRLVVVDQAGNESPPVEHAVTVTAVDQTPPTAVLTAPGVVEYGDPIVLSGADSSDPAPGGVVRWRWVRLAGGGGTLGVNEEIESDTAALSLPSPTGSPLSLGVHSFRLVVVDAAGNLSQPATADVLVRDSRAPVASLTAPRTVQPDERFVLDGGRSSDHPPGRVVLWTFTRLSGSGGDLRVGEPVTTETPSLTITPDRRSPHTPGEHRFRLVVTDGAGNQSAPVEVSVQVR
jgi:hypothetical protein